MQKLSLYSIIASIALLITVLYGCTKKMNGIDNSQIIETPYSLYFSDTAGALYNSNDGKTIQKIVFKADGVPCRAICTINNNLLWAKNNLYISMNNGKNFNHAFDSLAYYRGYACNGLYIDLNQSMIINIPSWNESFTVTNDIDPNNFLGVVFSLNYDGILGSWWLDIPDSLGQMGNYGDADPNYLIRMTSFTYMPNGVLAGYDAHSNRNFYRTQNTLWNECSANPDSNDAGGFGIGNKANRSGIQLPHHDRPFKTTRDTTARYSYGHYNNRLIAIDNINCNGNGAYYSDDTGRTWTQYPNVGAYGLPSKPLLCIASPFEEICLIGTDSAGLYMYNSNTGTWQQNVNGLGKNLVVRNIAFKENVYKNGTRVKYVYLATNQGIYQSTDGGKNWTLTIKGNYVAIY
jgi:hypothetical protein